MKTQVIGLLFFITVGAFAQQWTTYKDLELAFSADFNGEILTLNQDIPVGDSTVLKMKMLYVDNSSNAQASNTLYAVSRTDYNLEEFQNEDAARDKAVLDSAVNGAANNVKGKVLYSNTISLNGFPARAAKIEMPGAFIYANIYLVKNIMYFNQVICTIDKDNNKDIQRFLNSFELIKTK